MDEFEYTLAETIYELEGWARGERMFPIDTAISATYWLERAPSSVDPGKSEPSLQATIDRLNEWLKNEEPKLPDDLALVTLHWLKRAHAVVD
jgi:hypothetical protein